MNGFHNPQFVEIFILNMLCPLEKVYNNRPHVSVTDCRVLEVLISLESVLLN